MSPSWSQVEEVTTYGDVSIDEEIVLPKFDLETITIEKMNILQDSLAKKKNQELLRMEHKKKQALVDIKEIFLDAFSLLTPDENKHIIE